MKICIDNENLNSNYCIMVYLWIPTIFHPNTNSKLIY